MREAVAVRGASCDRLGSRNTCASRIIRVRGILYRLSLRVLFFKVEGCDVGIWRG